jgi:fumarylacetoacetase
MDLGYKTHRDFSIDNLPFGIFSYENKGKRVGVAIGDYVLDLASLAKDKLIDIPLSILETQYLNDLIGLGKVRTNELRNDLMNLILDVDFDQEKYVVAQSSVRMHMPVFVRDYTDFYSSEAHAVNVGKMFRDPDNALLPNWKSLPVAYHGRASSIYVSGTEFRRPCGQILENGSPIFSPTRQLDFELEMATVIGRPNEIGCPVNVNDAQEYVFGYMIFNDWSARDIQRWEYAPLGPFLGKNFFSSVSPWVVTAEALKPFITDAPIQSPEVLPYLKEDVRHNIDLNLEVYLLSESGGSAQVSNSNFKYMYWTVAQQIAHHTVNGCNLNIGDLLASGTISGSEEGSFGSLLEITKGGKETIILDNGEERTFLQDGDIVIMKAWGEKNGKRIGFGEVTNKILPYEKR